MRGSIALFALTLAATGAHGVAAVRVEAQDAGVAADRARQAAFVREADRAESEMRPRDAVALWQQALAAAPTSRVAARCETRIAYLSARSEGDYRPLADLMQMRTLPTSALSVAVLDGFAHRLDGYPHGHARREGRELVADAWLGRLGDAARGKRAYTVWLAEPALTDTERRLAASGLARSYTQLGDPAAALEAMRSVGLGASTDADDLRTEARRRVLRVVAWALLAAFVVFGVALGGHRGFRAANLRRSLSPLRLAAAAWVLGGPLLVASMFDHAATDTFVTLALAGGCVLLLAAILGGGFVERSARRRRVVAVAAFAAMLGVGFLVLDRAGFLLSLGL